MNIDNHLYKNYLQISNDWPLDDWSITKECFDKIVEILPFGKTILEIGSGNSTNILSKFYKMISIESNEEWMNKYKSKYIYVPFKEMLSEEFGHTTWLDIDILKQNISNLDYDLLLVDAGGDRVGIYDNINLFNTNIPIIFDDTMCEKYFKCANLLSNKVNKKIETFQCKKNKYCVNWWDGKKYSVLI
jgi:hypothetical protein